MMCWTACGSRGNPRHPSGRAGPEEKPLVEAAFSRADEPLLTSVIEPPKMPEEPVAPPVIVSERKPVHPSRLLGRKELAVYRCRLTCRCRGYRRPSPRAFFLAIFVR